MFFRSKPPPCMLLEPARAGRARLWWRCLRYGVVLITGVALGLLLFAGRGAAATTPADVSRGELLMYTEGTGARTYRSALQLHSKVRLRISGMVAEVHVDQRFRNETDRWQEGVYVFPLPENAAVNELTLQVGERVIKGEIRERAEARKIYQQAKKAGKKASLLEQQRPNMFTSRVANIAPGEEVSVQLRYIQQVDYDREIFSLRFPMTITPRYIPGVPGKAAPGDETPREFREFSAHGWASATDQVPDAAEITPPLQPSPPGAEPAGNTVEISAEIDAGLPLDALESVYHPVRLTRSGQRYSLHLVGGDASMERDFLLQWRPQAGSEPRAALFREQLGDQEYALLMLLPPDREGAAVLPRELVFVIDTSGSMGGTSITQARASLQHALGQLRSVDSFNIVEFNSSARALFHAAMPASPHNVARALEFVRHLDAGGGTEMRAALQLALFDAGAAGEANRLRQVVFITDGAVGNEAALFREIHDRLGRSRLFTVGIGSAPNSWFMQKAAQVGRGTATYIGDMAQVQTKMEELFDTLGAPLARDIRVDWPPGVEAYPARVPDLYRGQPVLIAAKLGKLARAETVIVSGHTADERWQRQLGLPLTAAVESAHAGVASIWARRKIAQLLDGKILGQPEPEVRAAVLAVALAHKLASPYTSFVAVEQRISRPASATAGSSALPNLPPAGQSPQPYAWPRTATGAGAQLLTGSLLILLALLLLFSHRLRWLKPGLR